MQINGAAYIVDLGQSGAAAKENAAADAGQAAGSESAAAEKSRGSGAAGRGRSIDRVDISSSGIEIDKLKRDLSAFPEVRLDRVALAKQSLQDGGYRVASGVLAQKMMESFATQ